MILKPPFGREKKILGGAATYIGLSASQFTLDCALISVIGEDFEERHLNLLKSKKIDISGVEIVKGGETFFFGGESTKRPEYKIYNGNAIECFRKF